VVDFWRGDGVDSTLLIMLSLEVACFKLGRLIGGAALKTTRKKKY